MYILGLISDVLLIAATVGMAIWCRILMHRIRDFNELDSALGDKIAALSLQVNDLQAKLDRATAQIQGRGASLDAATSRADDRIGRMEMLLASLEDLEDEAAARLDDHHDEVSASVPSFRASRPIESLQDGRD